MIGAIAGDVIGSVHEGSRPKRKDFPLFVPGSRFTDDTVLAAAVASAIRLGLDYAESLRHWGRRYPDAGYGGWFRHWLFQEEARPYNSFGNGSAMRVPAIGWAFDDLETILFEARRSAEVTHNHPEGIKGRRPSPPPCCWPAPGTRRLRSRAFSRGGSATTARVGSTTCGGGAAST